MDFSTTAKSLIDVTVDAPKGKALVTAVGELVCTECSDESGAEYRLWVAIDGESEQDPIKGLMLGGRGSQPRTPVTVQRLIDVDGGGSTRFQFVGKTSEGKTVTVQTRSITVVTIPNN